MNKPSIQRILELQELLLRFSEIDRVIHRRHGDVMGLENDSEHSYNLAMTAWFLAPHYAELDRDLLIRYALVHDLVEVHAGDTFAYGSDEELGSKATREKQAAQKLQDDWDDFPEIHTLIEEYEQRTNPEARFIYALDKIMPILQVYLNDGYSWKKHNITAKMMYDNKIDKIALSPEVQPYFESLYALLLDSPEIIDKE